MHVLIIAHSYPSKKYKMNSIFAFDQALALKSLGCEVTYFALDMRSVLKWRKWGLEHIKHSSINMYVYNFPGGRIAPDNLLNKIRRFGIVRLFKRLLRDIGKPDIVHAHFTEPGYAALELKNRYGIPLIVTEHSSKINKSDIEEYLREIAEETYNNADNLVTVSNHLKEKIIKEFGIESTVIPNIVNTEKFKFKEYIRSDTSYNFISTGSLNKNKNMDILILSFQRAFNNNKNVKLYIFGDGPERKSLLKMIHDYKLNDQIYLMGLVDRNIIAERMESSNCFILISSLETFGVAYIEALSMGLPVIANKSGGPQDFINNGNGILLNSISIEEVANAMLNMYYSSQKYNNKEISQNIINKYSPEIIANSLIDIYIRTIKGNNKV